ncbi:MAG: YeeE/YedE family protein [Cellvibrio sp.]
MSLASAGISGTLLLVFAIFLGWSNNDQQLLIALGLGAAFGVVLQRSRFCFFCVTRDYRNQRDASGLLAILVALIVGTIGYLLVFSTILPNPALGRLPPDAHIGPVSWVLAFAALVFGIGMTLSGSCVSAHLYRLGEGAIGSVIALIGVVLGFLLGFFTWNPIYLNVLIDAPIVWLPNHMGYFGTFLLQVGVLSLLALLLLKRHRFIDRASPKSIKDGLTQRWSPLSAGLGIGALGCVAFFTLAPLGVTAEIGSIARTLGNRLDLLPERLEGLDGFAGCATLVKEAILSINGVFVIGLILASLTSALACREFRWQPVNTKVGFKKLLGGVLLGWGSMTALGCTVGTLLSGIMAASLSGWVFAVFCFTGVWVSLRLTEQKSPNV